MYVNLLTDKALSNMKAAIKEHPEYYSAEEYPKELLQFEPVPDFELEDDFPELQNRKADQSIYDVDCENSIILANFANKNQIPISLISDQRFEAYLTHVVYFDYMKQRWSIDDKNAGANRIESRYFFGKQYYSRCETLKLFWIGLIGHRAGKLGLPEGEEDPWFYTRYIYKHFAMVEKLFERAFAKSPKIIKEVLDAMIAIGDVSLLSRGLPSKDGKCPQDLQRFGKRINNVLAVVSLDALSLEDGSAFMQNVAYELSGTTPNEDEFFDDEFDSEVALSDDPNDSEASKAAAFEAVSKALDDYQ